MSALKIQRVQITKLFDEINYDIHLPECNPVSIIIAPNGRGKTTILNLISLIFAPSDNVFNAVRAIPFDTFRCILSNGMAVELKKTEFGSSDKNSREVRHSAFREQLAEQNRSLFENGDIVFSIYKGKKRVASLDYYDTLADKIDYSARTILDEDIELLNRAQLGANRSMLKYVWKLQQSILNEHKCVIPVSYIRADRIQPPPIVIPSIREYREIAETGQKSPLVSACERISKLIIDSTDKYNEAVAQAKDKLPEMFLEGLGDDLSCEDFMAGWYVYRSELTRYQKLGLITHTKDFTEGKNIENVYAEKGKFLSTYLQAFKDTTEPLREIYEKLYLFQSILDERNAITGKKVSFSRDGVKLKVGEREISLDTLSSGEKHDFIMFYSLIMGGTTDGLVLIDEPEISLHIDWQETYLDKLLNICNMNRLQAIVATHSPNIVSSHYDFLVDKGESNGSSGI